MNVDASEDIQEGDKITVKHEQYRVMQYPCKNLKFAAIYTDVLMLCPSPSTKQKKKKQTIHSNIKGGQKWNNKRQKAFKAKCYT